MKKNYKIHFFLPSEFHIGHQNIVYTFDAYTLTTYKPHHYAHGQYQADSMTNIQILRKHLSALPRHPSVQLVCAKHHQHKTTHIYTTPLHTPNITHIHCLITTPYSFSQSQLQFHITKYQQQT